MLHRWTLDYHQEQPVSLWLSSARLVRCMSAVCFPTVDALVNGSTAAYDVVFACYAAKLVQHLMLSHFRGRHRALNARHMHSSALPIPSTPSVKASDFRSFWPRTSAPRVQHNQTQHPRTGTTMNFEIQTHWPESCSTN